MHSFTFLVNYAFAFKCVGSLHFHCSTVHFSYFLHKHSLFCALGVAVGDERHGVESDEDTEAGSSSGEEQNLDVDEDG